MNQPLFNIIASYEAIMDQVELQEGELTEDLAELLTITSDAWQSKAKGYSKFIQKLEADIAAADAELKRVQAFKKRKSVLLERLEQALLNGLMTFGSQDSKGIYRYESADSDGIISLSTRRSQVVAIEDQTEIPAEFFRVKPAPPPEPDKVALKKALQDGVLIPGVTLRENYAISIK